MNAQEAQAKVNELEAWYKQVVNYINEISTALGDISNKISGDVSSILGDTSQKWQGDMASKYYEKTTTKVQELIQDLMDIRDGATEAANAYGEYIQKEADNIAKQVR